MVPEAGFAALPDDALSFLLFPVERPELFDAVVLAEDGTVVEIQVKRADAASRWIWGAFKMPGAVFHALHALWIARERQDEYFGTLVNAFIAAAAAPSGSRPARPTSTPAPSTATAPPWACSSRPSQPSACSAGRRTRRHHDTRSRGGA